MSPGDYRVIRKDVWVDNAFKTYFDAGKFLVAESALATSTSTDAAAQLTTTNSISFSFVPILIPNYLPASSTPLVFTLGADGSGPASASTVQTNDPRNNTLPSDWAYVPGSNTLGSENAPTVRTVGKTSSVTPPQDTDASGNISDASLQMAYPKGNPKNPDGVVQSVGELGVIHTGIEGLSTRTSVPWRTLRLQPTAAQPASVVPDWAFMDLFTVPTVVPTAAKKMFTPYDSHVAGRINVNSKAEPFGNSTAMGNGTLTRIAPLKALLTGVTNNGNATLTAVEATTIATNIYNRTLSPGKGKTYGFAGGYDSPGEIAEIAGVADGGEASEEVMRGIANLISARGSVFTVSTIGQSLKQTPANTLVITGEQRQQVMLEGYPDTASTTKYRPVSVRTLTP
jgi:hypothetical protein